MKDSRKYAKELSRFFRSARQQAGRVEPVAYDDPLEALVYGILSEHTTGSQAQNMYRKIKNHFIDLNDLRVCRIEEVLDVVSLSSEQMEKTAQRLQTSLNNVMNAFDMVSLASLEETGKRQARKQLEKLTPDSPFAVDFCFLAGLEGHTIPLTASMTEYLRANGLACPDADLETIHGFLERQLNTSDAYAFYFLLRQAAEGQLKPSETDGKKSQKKTSKK